jgi:hypothetical protein
MRTRLFNTIVLFSTALASLPAAGCGDGSPGGHAPPPQTTGPSSQDPTPAPTNGDPLTDAALDASNASPDGSAPPTPSPDAALAGDGGAMAGDAMTMGDAAITSDADPNADGAVDIDAAWPPTK